MSENADSTACTQMEGCKTRVALSEVGMYIVSTSSVVSRYVRIAKTMLLSTSLRTRKGGLNPTK